MEENELKHIAHGIVELISQTLLVYLGPISRKFILGHVLSHSQIIIDLPDHI
jgi:hypothetical protein